MKENKCLPTAEDIALEEQNPGACLEIQNIALENINQYNQRMNKVCAFGTCLEYLMTSSSEMTVPYVVSRLCKYIEEYGLYQQCLFQEKEPNRVVDGLKKKFNEFGDAPLESSGNVPAASLLLKLFFEELPEPLIPTCMQSNFVNEMKECIKSSGDCIKNLKLLVDQLPCPAFCVLKYLSHFLLRVAKHGQVNGLSCANLGIIFGPIIFRSNKADPLICIMIGNITHHFVSDYYSIFEEHHYFKDQISRQLLPALSGNLNSFKASPLPSTDMSDVIMQPLNVVIPHIDDLSVCSDDNLHTPLLLIASSTEKYLDGKAFKKSCNSKVLKKFELCPSARRKRKDNLLIQKSLIHDVSSLQNLLMKQDDPHASKTTHHDQDNLPIVDVCHKNEYLTSAAVSSNISANESFTIESPHPPNPKRRELNSEEHLPVSAKLELNHLNINKKFSQNYFADANEAQNDEEPILDSYFQFLNTPVSDNELSTCTKASQSRPSSCPLPMTDNVEHDGTSLTQGWNMLFDFDEPVRAHYHHFMWTGMKENTDENTSVPQNMQNISLFEAPLSPSAFRNYLSHRSSHLDSNTAPSPPLEQLHFEKNPVTDDNISLSVKQLSKKIHVLKKKILCFEENYESEYGYKPSHAEKAKFHEGKKLLNDLHNARKELKALKEESHLIADSFVDGGIWASTKDAHILEDTTNYLSGISKNINTNSKLPNDSFKKTQKSLFFDKKCSAKPEAFGQTSGQVKIQKSAAPKSLSNCGSSEGINNNVRPTHERHHNTKSLLVRSSSFPTHSKNNFKSLQPIMEHETMDFSFMQKEIKMNGNKYPKISEVTGSNEIGSQLNSSSRSSPQFLDMKYNNSNLHELSLSALITEQQHARMERRRLHKILREFEAEFLRINGRKVQRDDKSPVESIYIEYKLAKARLRLLEALISKHHEHIFI